jgi:hypothetical protein
MVRSDDFIGVFGFGAGYENGHKFLESWMAQ